MGPANTSSSRNGALHERALRRYAVDMRRLDSTDRGELYNTLMGREKDTLRVLDRIVNFERERHSSKTSFMSMSLSRLVIDMVSALGDIGGHVVKFDDFGAFVDYLRGDNKNLFYLGIVACLVGVVLLMLEFA